MCGCGKKKILSPSDVQSGLIAGASESTQPTSQGESAQSNQPERR